MEEGMGSYLQYVGGMVGAAVLTGAAISTGMYLISKPKPIRLLADIADQSLELADSARVSKIYKGEAFVHPDYQDIHTLHDLMPNGHRVSGDGPCLGQRKDKDSPYEWIKYSDVIERSKNFGCGLVALGLTPGKTNFMGIYAKNCIEWILAEQGCYHFSFVVVPLYDTLGPQACTYIMNQAEISMVVCDTEEKCEALLKASSATPTLKTIICVQEPTGGLQMMAQQKGVTLKSFQQVEDLGKENPLDSVPPKPADLATVCYTSGTTGDPKGVMLSHGNIVANITAVVYQLADHTLRASDVMIGFLPLAHMLERCCESAIYMSGGSVGFYSGDIRLLMDDLKALKPTVMPCVPRLLNKIYDKVYAGVNGSALKKWLLNLALQSKTASLDQHIVLNNGFWDSLVFKPVRNGLGGRLRLMVLGSAPLAGNVLTFMRCAIGCVIVEGYGQTECVAPCTLQMVGDHSTDHVGTPIPTCSVKLVDVPEMEYFAAEKKGEVCVKGATVFQGYFKDTVKTTEVLDNDGWLHTGDIGMWLPNGTLRIVDRKKHIFKLSQGEYIAPEKIENVYLKSVYISQIFVYGESLKSCLVAIVVPDKEVLTNWCNENEVRGSWAQICDNKQVNKTILTDLIQQGKKGGLKTFEQVNAIYLFSDCFSMDNSLLTPTLKTKRPECRKFFRSQIDLLYSELV